ncbi:DUF1800 family protein [Acidisphaera sp. L21]|uniref:DUF1800 domain-containing protein n=1 Tax=Acidisphaera sp. L21 TaxID=1641851 RepID=UPI00131DF769|nr:DUF1800 domain-containing protein [Acidisphaera sp. L21]
MDNHAAQAMIRFGLGRRGQEPLPDDPTAWLRAQLRGADPGPPGSDVAQGFYAIRLDQENKPQPGTPGAVRTLFKAEQDGLVANAITTATPFRERLVWFWANHFTVSLRNGRTGALGGDFIRTAIRPYATGKFSDMLLAVIRHPAMLLYLDNAASIGPNSVVGKTAKRGLNENLARECLELHTVSPASGYTQEDVTSFARVLTGWSVANGDRAPPGFLFRSGIHEPGAKTVLGHEVPQGEAGGTDMLAFLAAHPATYRHLATKLVQHFVADTPPPAAVHTIEAVLRDTKGDLGQAAAALVGLPAAWEPLVKLRTPQDYVLAVLRAVDLPETKRPDGAGLMRALGQPLFGAPFPIGWPDQAVEWAGPEAMMRRVDWAYGFSGRAAALDPAMLAEASLGSFLTADTNGAIRGAGSRRDGLTLLFTSPEFQRR